MKLLPLVCLTIALKACLLCAQSTAVDSQAAVRQSLPANLQPFVLDHRRGALKPSPVSVEFLLDAPAGKHGYVVVKDGHLATEDGKRIRFWGVNVTDWSKGSQQIPEKQDAAFLASTLARFGINSVRFQFLDLEIPRGLMKKTRDGKELFDADALDREDYFVAELEKKGIYLDFNLMVGRPFRASEGVESAALLHEGSKGTSLYDARMIELQKEYARQLLTHRNPYTQRTYAEDPAVAIVEINNENAIGPGFMPPSDFYRKELVGLYGKWLAAHRTPAQIDQLRSISGAKDGEEVPLIVRKTAVPEAPPERFYAESAFYNDLERGYFEAMESYLKSTVQIHSLVIATADHSHASSGYPILLATRGMDIIDGHTYWQHPEYYVTKLPMVDDPANSTVAELSRSAIAGKPYTVSEVNNPFPNDYAGEGIPILAAYGGLQDWDAIYWYTFEPKRDPKWKPYVGDPFDVSLDPVKMPELAAVALQFLRDDVSKAKQTEMRTYTEHQIFDSALLPNSERPFYTPGFPPTLPLEHEVRIASLTGSPTQPFPIAIPTDPIASDTGELHWFTGKGKGMVEVDSPRTQEIVGFVSAHNDVSTANLRLAVENTFCNVMLSSLDTRPISSSSRLLLVAGGPVENTGQHWNTAHTDVTDLGGSPTLVQPVVGTLTLHGLAGAKSVRMQAIDGAGQRLGESLNAASVANGEWALPLGSVTTTWYLIEVER